MKWIIMPVLAGPEMTEAAINDCVAQSVSGQVLVINQGVDDAFRDRLERIAEEIDQVHVWHHNPPLPSLAATWNRALDFVWQAGGNEALVINNDVRLHRETVWLLDTVLTRTKALFVSAIGVTAEQFDPNASLNLVTRFDEKADLETVDHKGGPDFSCYMISKTCHERWRFDENFVPAYCEDLDYHRRLMLDGHADKIFSVNLPYYHIAAGTLKQIDPQRKMKIESQIGSGSRAYYAKKWGGPVNQETFYAPFGNAGHVLIDSRGAGVDVELWRGRCGPTTPEIQQWCRDRVIAPTLADFQDMDTLLKDANEPAPVETTPAPTYVRAAQDEDIPF